MGNYSGDRTATQAPGPAPAKDATPIGDLPDDGDAVNAASVAQAFKECLDYLDHYTHHALFRDIAASLTQTITIDNGGTLSFETDNTDADIEITHSGTIGASNRKLYHRARMGTTVYARFFRTTGPGWELTYNADWYDSGGGTYKFQRDAAGDAFRLAIDTSGITFQYYLAASASPWVNASWVTGFSANNAGLFTSAAGFTATTADFTATAGDFVGQHIVGNATNPTCACTLAGAGDAGAGAPPTPTITGNDIGGKVAFTSGTGCAGGSTIFTVTFDETFGAAPSAVTLTPGNAAAAALWTGTKQPYVSSIAAGSFVVSSNTTAIDDSTAFAFYYQIVG